MLPLKELAVPVVGWILSPIAIWAAPVLWHRLQMQVPDSILARGVALLFVLLCWSVAYILQLRSQIRKSQSRVVRGGVTHAPDVDPNLSALDKLIHKRDS